MIFDFIMIRTRIWDRRHGYKRDWDRKRENAMHNTPPPTVHHHTTIRTVAEIYGFEQVVIIGKKAGHADFVASYGNTPLMAQLADSLGEYLRFKLKQWTDCGIDKLNVAPPPGASS